MNGQSIGACLPAYLTQPGTQFYLLPDFNEGISVQSMLAWLPFYSETDLARTVAVTPSNSLYMKLCGDPGWRLVALGWLPRGLEPEYLLPSPVGRWNPEGGLEARPTPAEGVMGWFSGLGREGVGDTACPLEFGPETTADERAREGEEGACMQLETLPQRDYLDHPRAQAPEMVLEVPYDCVSLPSALAERDISSPDEPAFPADAPIGVKISICLWLEGVQSPRTLEGGFSSKQHRVRKGDKKGRPITRAKLARLVAADVFEFMVRRLTSLTSAYSPNHPSQTLHKVVHKGEVVAFEQVCLKKVCLKSKATIQPVLCLRPSPVDTGPTAILCSVQ
ncbi:uncharacterized protein TRAVEDRAFT_47805 [Trametes versicolor FP-101664 SS1]|uniref:uncharacterized protein n=1 Tax=Trametes versicolor (strain FP-101664) TaxID=717944 RepID=UPI000462190E|nr:uncharacterized protein TRAVEDRAFT_47805 [Trametes versicolor FP-101664 SS1]EIW58663.1 hypothetical protein TRAVEDRAFT_47805 [Trametes versicolor FP-101664 SS1]